MPQRKAGRLLTSPRSSNVQHWRVSACVRARVRKEDGRQPNVMVYTAMRFLIWRVAQGGWMKYAHWCCAVGIFLCFTAQAGTLYECKTPGSATPTFRDTPCPVGTRTVKHKHFNPDPNSPPVTTSVDTRAPQPEPNRAQPPPAQPRQAAEPIVAWICVAGARTWLSFAPCPATYEKPTAVPVNGNMAFTGAPVSGTALVNQTLPVQSEPLTASQVCDMLDDQSSSVPIDTYKRLTLKGKFCQ